MARRYPMSDAMQAFVARTQAFTEPDPSPAAQRAAYQRMALAFTPSRPPGLRISELCLDRLPSVRLYRPVGSPPDAGWPTLLYLHGGGWILGGLDSHDFICAELAAELGALVVAVDYRLAPEHPYPAALHDCLAVWRRLYDNTLGEPVDRARLLVIGDSAGGNLAAALCLSLRDAGEPLPCGQVLIYPVLGDADTSARALCADAPLLSRADLEACLSAYLPHAGDRRDPLALPLRADHLRGLPRAFIAVAEFDPLRDDGALYRDRLREAGVAVDYFAGAGLVHGCLRGRDIPEVAELRGVLLETLRRWLC
ncbi:alpha/beta hydrolase [Pseudomonas sp. PDNC002]|uniref:alpha/beta hydrolase n=1 Tax=Pseudomonas sp. PDNC002 TaxID=2811422 RepID=UPI0019656D7C|nr:alpha/beta hydrolase [Pseudomonas sp. PDNC002]QRY80492.1 alpha/beta hydrolase [Pseudomonas sp. PDNC002]